MTEAMATLRRVGYRTSSGIMFLAAFGILLGKAGLFDLRNSLMKEGRGGQCHGVVVATNVEGSIGHAPMDVKTFISLAMHSFETGAIRQEVDSFFHKEASFHAIGGLLPDVPSMWLTSTVRGIDQIKRYFSGPVKGVKVEFEFVSVSPAQGGATFVIVKGEDTMYDMFGLGFVQTFLVFGEPKSPFGHKSKLLGCWQRCELIVVNSSLQHADHWHERSHSQCDS
eukprot:GHVS01090245.1.p1 GENE.GHVS01090245.1~~GHVS01090245.1.p1  ORF type:complete len:224 (-),score=17.23 GHVS01090245.1:139-810(-)